MIGLAVSLALLVAEPLDWAPFEGTAFDGSPLPGELTRIEVPESPEQRDRMIEIAFVRYRTSNPDPGPPIFFLAGGPGGSGVDLAASLATHPQIRLLEHADVIGIDQRGIGRSRPNLMEPNFPLTLPFDEPLRRAQHVTALRAAGAASLSHWRDRGVNLQAYTTSNSASDLDQVRAALGVEQVRLYGSSYGSHLGLAYLRDFGARVHSAILTGVEGPDDTWKRPAVTHEALVRLHRRLVDQPDVPNVLRDLLGLVQELQRELAAQPVVSSHAKQRIVLGPYDLNLAIARSLPDSGALARLPGRLLQAHQGDWSWFAEQALLTRRGQMRALPVLMDCASSGSPERLQQVARETRDAAHLLGDALLAPIYPDLCSGAAELAQPRIAHETFACDARVLFVSGTLDARTPPENAERLLPGFPQAAHVVIEQAGHDGRGLLSRDYRDLLQRFLRGEPVRSCTIRLPPPVLQLASD